MYINICIYNKKSNKSRLQKTIVLTFISRGHKKIQQTFNTMREFKFGIICKISFNVTISIYL